MYAEAERSLAEVGERETLAELEGGNVMRINKIWERSHEDIFKRVLAYSEERRHAPDFSGFPPVVVRVAERWAEANAIEKVRFVVDEYTENLTGLVASCN